MKTLIGSLCVLLMLAGGLYVSTSNGNGSRRRAAYWQERLARVTSVERAIAENPDLQALRFADGEWMVVAADGSHMNPFGGTVVIKDSRGGLHTYFGHVCGRPFIEGSNLQEAMESARALFSTTIGGDPDAEASRAVWERRSHMAEENRRRRRASLDASPD